MYDSAPLQALANGTCGGIHGALVTVATGAVVTSPGVGGTAGTYTITLDQGLIGASSDVSHLRVFINGLTLANATVQVTKATNVITVVIAVGSTGVATDSGFDFVIFKDTEN